MPRDRGQVYGFDFKETPLGNRKSGQSPFLALGACHC